MFDGEADLLVPALPVTSCNDDLQADTKTQGKHYHHEVIDTSNSACTQSKFPYPAQEGRIRDIQQVLGYAAQDDRICDLPDLRICDGSFQIFLRDWSKITFYNTMMIINNFITL